jgi:2-polyprenyl-3-methyl-5-hydroxy-6-metoxy-1,4-benzoquinol methylase
MTSYLRQKRISTVRPFLCGDILDIGCGPADLIFFLGREQRYVGIEVDGELVQRLRKRFPAHEFYQADVEIDELVSVSGRFDTVTMIALIEHLSRPANVVKQCYSLLKNHGELVITTPTPLGAKVHKIGSKLGLTSKEAVSEHHRIYTREDLENLLASFGFVIREYRTFMLGMNQLLVCRRL